MKKILSLLSILIITIAIYAQVPQTINFQGALKDANGEPVNDSKYMEFRIYDVLTGGTALWTEQHSAVSISTGIFSVELGSITPFPDGMLNNSEIYITYLLGGETNEMSPRQKILSTPYALRADQSNSSYNADNAEALGGVPLTGLIPQDSLGNSIISGTMTANAFVGDGSGLTGITTIYDSLYLHKAGPDTMQANSGLATLTIQNTGIGDGISVESTGDDGINIKTVATDGLHIHSAGDNGIQIEKSLNFGVRIDSTGNDGIYIKKVGNPNDTNSDSHKNGFEVAGAEGNGLYVGRADYDGVFVYNAADDGVDVYKSGNPTIITPSTLKNGFEVEGAEGNGLFVGYTDINGVYVKKAAYSGVYIDSTSQYGMMINSAGSDGIRVYHAGDHGLNIDYAYNGIYIGQTTYDGIYVFNSGADGLYVRYAGDDGVEVQYADGDGINVNTTESNGEYGVYTPDKIYGSNLTTRTINNIGRNSGFEQLEAGDIVCLSGYEKNVLGDSNIPIIKITKADRNNSRAVIGVVEYKVYIREENEEYEGKTITRKSFRFAEGNANKGDYVSIIILGPAAVKVNSKEDIKTGESLTSNNGLAKKIRTTEINGITIAENVGIIGKALEDSNGKDKIKVYVNCK